MLTSQDKNERTKKIKVGRLALDVLAELLLASDQWQMPPKEVNPARDFNQQDLSGIMKEFPQFIDALAYGVAWFRADFGREFIKKVLTICPILVVTLAPGMFFEGFFDKSLELSKCSAFHLAPTARLPVSIYCMEIHCIVTDPNTVQPT
jgi:hypothetical protein